MRQAVDGTEHHHRGEEARCISLIDRLAMIRCSAMVPEEREIIGPTDSDVREPDYLKHLLELLKALDYTLEKVLNASQTTHRRLAGNLNKSGLPPNVDQGQLRQHDQSRGSAWRKLDNHMHLRHHGIDPAMRI